MAKLATAPPPTPEKAEAAKKATAAKKAAPKAPPTPRPQPAARSNTSLLDTARPLSDVVDYANVLYCGDNGTGKTAAIAAMANLGPVIIINAEGGLRKGALRRRGINVDNIKVLPEKPEDLTYEFLERLYLEIKMALEDAPGSIVGIGWDSITEITQKLLENVVSEAQDKAEAKNESRDPFFTDIADYGVMAKQVRQLIRRYRDLECHFAASTLLKRDIDDDSKVVYRPQVIPSLRADLMGYMDLVVVTDVQDYNGDDEYRGLFKPVGKFRGKDRFGCFPRRLLDPTFDRLMGYIEDEITLENDPVMLAAKAKRLANKGEIAELTDAPDEQIDAGTDAADRSGDSVTAS